MFKKSGNEKVSSRVRPFKNRYRLEKKEDLGKVQVMVESTYGDSHPGSGHLNILVEEVRKGIAEEGGYGARYYCTDICDGESQGNRWY